MYIDNFQKAFDVHMAQIIDNAMANVLDKIFEKYDYIVYNKSRYHKIADVLNEIKIFMLDKMDSESDHLDSHKLATIASLAILKCKPLMFSKNGKIVEAPFCNEILAFITAMDIITAFQIKDIFKGDSDSFHNVMKQITGTYIMPPKINDELPVAFNLTCSLYHLTNDCDCYSAAWLMSHIYFFIDSYSRNSMVKLAQQIYGGEGMV